MIRFYVPNLSEINTKFTKISIGMVVSFISSPFENNYEHCIKNMRE